jgi:siderophore synthetase component
MTIADASSIATAAELQRAGRRVLRQQIEALVYEGVLAAALEDGELQIEAADDRGGPVSYVCFARRTESFGRVRLDEGPIVRVAGHDLAPTTDPPRFLREAMRAAGGADPELVERFAHELARTVRNDAAALTAQRRRSRLLRSRSYEELEGALPDGHRYHPAYKSRVGFSDEDNQAFGPEFEPGLRPIWVTLPRERCVVARSAAVEIDLPDVPADRVAVPVHPWQWREHGPAGAEPLGEADDEYRPQQSIRTLWNATAPEKPNLKLSLGIVNTSTGRLLAPHTVANAPAISDWLHGVVAGDPLLSGELGTVVLREVRGVAAPPFGCIWRESLRPRLDAAESALPFTGLVHRDLDGRPLIASWIEAHGCEAWLRRLLEVSVVPLVHLLCAHGIALEGHAQNMVLIHAGGWPRRVALRDFHDGVRFSAAHLADPSARPPLRPTPPEHARVNRNSYIETDDPLDVRDFVHDAFFFVNLSELALFLDAYFDLPEERFWTIAQGVVLAHRARHPALAKRFALFDVLAPRVRVEQLAKRRLYPDDELRLQEAPNPLAAAAIAGRIVDRVETVVTAGSRRELGPLPVPRHPRRP